MTERIGKYEVINELGRGATSTVFLARDPFSAREVALKVLSSSVGAPTESAKIQRKLLVTEASLAGKLTHPHIVQIFDAVVDSDPAYIVMEYVSGGTLERFCAPDKLLPVSDVVEMIFKCTRALDFAQQLGLIHRDLKPANIMHVEGTDVKISDFGAAFSMQSDQTQIAGIGSPAYMSPQQVKEHPLNHQSDMFSLGVVMYQLLTGQLPFQGSNPASIIYQIVNVDPTPPSALRVEIPAAVDAIVMKALKKGLDDRYQTWYDFSFDLAEIFRCEFLPELENEFADSEKFNTLRTLSFFSGFSDVEIWEVLRLSRWKRVHAGETVLREGDPGDNFCLLASGEVRVTKGGRLLNILSAGECFGEMAYLNPDNGIRGASVATLSDSTVVTIDNSAVERATDLCKHSFDRAFLRILVERLNLANTRLISV